MSNRKSNLTSIIKNNVLISAIIGNSLDHYDMALYGFLAPYIAPLFFPHTNSTVSLIYAYSLMSASLITRPLGALYFGKLSILKGSRRVFIYSLWGVALSTVGMGMLPDYNAIGIYAPLLLISLRIIQGFFAAGEATVAPLFIVKNSPSFLRGYVNGIYQSSTIAGILLASLAATATVLSKEPHFYWRLPFLLSILTGIAALYLRYKSPEQVSLYLAPLKINNILIALNKRKYDLLRIIAVSSLSYLSYAISFIFMNAFIPTVSQVSFETAMNANTFFLTLDMCLLPLFGKLADHLGIKRTMVGMAIILGVSVIPLFVYIPSGDIVTISLIRLWIICCGLGFSAPIHAWYAQTFKGQDVYLLTGVGYAIGSELFGRTAPSLCLWLWYLTQCSIAPAIYISIICFSAVLALKIEPK